MPEIDPVRRCRRDGHSYYRWSVKEVIGRVLVWKVELLPHFVFVIAVIFAMEDTLKYISTSPATIGAVALSLASVGYVVAQRLNQSSRSKEVLSPPGPPREFLIGNLRQFPKDHFYAKFCEWQKEYGDIVSVEMPGVHVVIINSYETIQDILAKRPGTTSGRQIGYMVLELMGMDWALAHIQPGPHFSEQRKMLRRGIGPQRVGSHDEKIEKHATRLMVALKNFKGSPRKLIQRTLGRSVIEVAYGEKMLDLIGDELLSWNGESMHLYEENFVKLWLVDIFNFLRFIPSWVPGAGFRKIGNRASWLNKKIRHVPFEKAKELYKSGEIGHSLTTDLFDEFGPTDDVRDAVAVLYLAGVETTTAAIMAYFHAMYLFPEIANKIHEEIVNVTGGSRLPTTADRPALRYTEAVWKEAFRWNSFVPLAIPHVTQKDEILKGYFIKAGTMIHYNNGFILSDPNVWGDPEAFRPERFLGPGADDLPNPLVISFGYGMRVCPGMYLADRTGFQIASTMSALYDLTPLEGRSRTKPDSVEYTDTLLRLPEGFECCFIPRNEKVEQILRTSELDY